MSHGLSISIQLDNTDLSHGTPASVSIHIQNASGKTFWFEGFVSFRLCHDGDAEGYLTFFDIAADEPVWVFHSTSTIVVPPTALIYKRIDITQLGWVSAADSRPPYTDFYDLIRRGRYDLDLEMAPNNSEDSPIRSNRLEVSINE